MVKVRIEENTWLKKSTKQSSELPNNEKFKGKPGQILEAITVEPAAGKHVKVQLKAPLLGDNTASPIYYAYEPHISYEKTHKVKKGSLAQRFVELCEEKGYPLDRTGGVNIIGIEGMNLDGTLNNDAPDIFNDLVGILRIKGGEAYFEHLYVATTEAGRPYTENDYKRHKDGAARIALGYHNGIWTRGKHRNRYDALVQWGNVVSVHRDLNKDYSRIGDKVYTGWFGINLHSTRSDWTPDRVGEFSAACQVIRKWDEFIKLRASVYASPKTKFDYIIVMGSWLV